MDPITAALIISAIASGASMYMNKRAEKAQKEAQTKAEDASRQTSAAETARIQQTASNAASNNRRRTVNKKPATAGTGAAGNVQTAGTQGLTTSNGGVNPQAGNAGTF